MRKQRFGKADGDLSARKQARRGLKILLSYLCWVFLNSGRRHSMSWSTVLRDVPPR